MLRRLGPSPFTMKHPPTVARNVVTRPFQINRRPVGFSLITTKNCSKTRSFYSRPSYRTDGDRLKSREDANRLKSREDAKIPVCQICRAHPITHHDSKLSTVHGGALDYITTSFCDQCWVKQLTELEEKESKKQEEMDLGKEKLDKLMEYVRGLRSTEQVPLAYVLQRLMDELRFERDLKWRAWFRSYLTECMVQDLELVKEKLSPKKGAPPIWVCNKSRVDAMDFKLWFYHARSGYIQTPPRWRPGVKSIITS